MSRIRSVHPEQWRKDSEAWGSARSNLYVIQEGDNGVLKVGIAGHPVRRLMMLQTGNYRRLHLRAVFEGTDRSCMAVEAYLLRYFDRAGGEWFFADLSEVLRVIEAFTVNE